MNIFSFCLKILTSVEKMLESLNYSYNNLKGFIYIIPKGIINVFWYNLFKIY